MYAAPRLSVLIEVWYKSKKGLDNAAEDASLSGLSLMKTERLLVVTYSWTANKCY